MDISREDLYLRVWATPMRTLAKEFGVSDVALSKACRRNAVPTPPPGYWTQLAHGKAAKRPALPATPQKNTISFSPDKSAAQRRAAPVVAVKPVHVQVAETTGDLAPFARATLQALSKVKPDAAGLVSSRGAAHFTCVASPASLERAARILDAIERKLPELGGQVIRGTDKTPCAWSSAASQSASPWRSATAAPSSFLNPSASRRTRARTTRTTSPVSSSWPSKVTLTAARAGRTAAARSWKTSLPKSSRAWPAPRTP
jgi:hypothetical protein